MSRLNFSHLTRRFDSIGFYGNRKKTLTQVIEYRDDKVAIFMAGGMEMTKLAFS